MDFGRAQFVNELEGKEDVLLKRLEALRSKVEQARLVNYRLAHAEAVLDKQLQVAAHRRSEVGFVRDAVADAGRESLHLSLFPALFIPRCLRSPPFPPLRAPPSPLLSLRSKLTPVTPLDAKAQSVVDALSSLHSNLDDVKMQPRTPGLPAGAAWETGRQAYLSWAVGKALAGGREGEVPADRLDFIERQTAEVGTEAELEQLSKAALRT